LKLPAESFGGPIRKNAREYPPTTYLVTLWVVEGVALLTHTVAMQTST